ncbi:M24 family metallopeptidase [Dyella kyungheensis]|uniref:Aminopeptidase P family protein n=1 Tax=Dyella kyungheensis TaxID=1242174 RepID=A0ABS2JVK3_9GAMM|nr:Xaa-Pro peptidase family protein [Dyella kyungheensis]MBM7123047.1 aminopeptidase P family protein [Dyella kyungheensis]
MRRRDFLTGAVAATAAVSTAALLRGQSAQASPAAPNALAGLTSMTTGAKPISVEERRARIAKLQRLMVEQKIGALILESGSSLDYFTGIQWHRSERTTAAVIPARGGVVVVTPAFEEPSIRETLAVGDDVRPWNEHENPFALIVAALRDRGVTSEPIAFESTTRLFIVDGVREASAGAYRVVSGDALVKAVRLIKTPAELALMQTANDVTLAALRYVHGHVRSGMRPDEIATMMNAATEALGGAPEFALVLINEASAYPHGSHQPQTLHEGSVILMDVGCTVHGYQSDISRTWVMGEPTAKQRKVWNTVKRGQEIALATAKLGTPVGTIDDAVRGYYEREGWGPGYKLPGLPHRTGHGIGLDGHESPYLVHGDATPLAVGMCFSDEPGLYIPGEFGIRLEDCWHMTETGPRLFTGLAKSIDDPI